MRQQEHTRHRETLRNNPEESLDPFSACSYQERIDAIKKHQHKQPLNKFVTKITNLILCGSNRGFLQNHHNPFPLFGAKNNKPLNSITKTRQNE
jgi:hypothetical protein